MRAKGPAQVDALPLVVELARPGHLRGDFAQQSLGEVHHVRVVGMGLIELEHRELGVVFGGDALVAKIAIYLEHLFEAAHHQALEVQLRSDPQVHVESKGMVVGTEGAGDGASGQALHHWRLDLEKAALYEEGADESDNAAPSPKRLAGGLAGDEVEIASAVAQLGVAEAVPLSQATDAGTWRADESRRRAPRAPRSGCEIPCPALRRCRRHPIA